MSPGGFRANAPDLDVPAMERDLARIPAVSSVRVVVEEEQLHEVHIVCGTGRAPKLIGRDVQSLLAARWGIDIDHRKVSVVQLEGDVNAVDLTGEEAADALATAAPPPVTADASGAPRIVRVTVSVTGDEAEATVAMAIGERQVLGQARGGPSWVGQRRLAATAAIEALVALVPAVGTCELGDITLLGAGSDSVMVTAVSSWRDGVEHTFAGAAPVGAGGELRAAAEAVLRAFPTS